MNKVHNNLNVLLETQTVALSSSLSLVNLATSIRPSGHGNKISKIYPLDLFLSMLMVRGRTMQKICVVQGRI